MELHVWIPGDIVENMVFRGTPSVLEISGEHGDFQHVTLWLCQNSY